MSVAEVFWSWKSAAACCCAGGMTVAEWCWGDPTTPDGRGLALVCVLLTVDFLLGNIVALLAHPVEWRLARFRQFLGKLLMWGSLLLIARRLAEPIGIVWADPVLHWMGDYLIVTLALVDLGSILRHLRRLSAMADVRTPMLDRALDALDAAAERVLKVTIPRKGKPCPLGRNETCSPDACRIWSACKIREDRDVTKEEDRS